MFAIVHFMGSGITSGTQRCRTDLGTDPFLSYCVAQFERRDSGEIDYFRQDTDGVCARVFACDF